jgi:protocatechuate 3,4-dioxygenase beta subunit
MSRARPMWLAMGIVLVVVVVIAWLRFRVDSTPPGLADEGPPTLERSRSAPATDPPGALATSASISGTVVSLDDPSEAIADARVCAWSLGRDERVLNPHAPRCTRSGVDGRFRLAGLEPGSYRTSASASGRVPQIWADPVEREPKLRLGAGEARADIEFTLAKGGLELGGTVVDVAGGTIEGALVVASSWPDRQPVATAISDEHGRFSAWVAHGEYSLKAAADGYAPVVVQARAPNRQIELRLTPESVIVGRVVDAQTGKGVAAVTVTADGSGRWSDAGLAVSSAEDGSFRLAGLSPGNYQPEAIGPGVYGRAASPVHVGLGQTSAPIELRVFPAHRLRGQIVAFDARASADERERGCARGQLSLSGAGVERWAEADDEGWVTLEGVVPGRHELRIECSGAFESLAQRLELAADLDDQRWMIEVGGIAIRGRAVDDRGRGVEGVFVDSLGPGGGAFDRTSSDGGFELRVREAGVHQISAELRGRDEPVVVVMLEVGDAGLDEVELRVGEVAALRGRVEDPEGRPVANLGVALCDARGRPRRWTKSDGEGRFGFDSLAPGRRWVALPGEVDVDSRGPVGEPVELSSDHVAEIVRVTEARVGSIRGRVRAEGGPAEDAWVVAGRGSVDDLIHDWEVGPILCDLEGRFELGELGEGSWAVRAFRSDGSEASVGGVELGAIVELELAASASLAGRVSFRDGSTPEQFELTASSGDRRRSATFYRSEGEFDLAGLPAGKWTLKAVSTAGSGELTVELGVGEQLTDLVLELETRVAIRGRLVDSRTGEPVRSVELTIQESRKFRRNATHGKDGAFEFDGLTPGRVEIWVFPRVWRGAPYPLQSMILDVAAEPSVQDVGDLPVAGGQRRPGQTPGQLGFESRIAGHGPDLARADSWRIEVTEVTRNGPADLAGLRVGDVITSIDGASVEGRHARAMGIYTRKVVAGATVVVERRGTAKIEIVAAAR